MLVFYLAVDVFCSYLVIEVPSNIVMKKIKPNVCYYLSSAPMYIYVRSHGLQRWLPFLVALWGVVTTLTFLVSNAIHTEPRTKADAT